MKRLCLVMLMLVMAMPALAGSVTPLTPANVTDLLSPPASGVKVIEFWALDCAYCEVNLQAVARFKASHRQAHVILVATDNIAHAEALKKRLANIGVADLPTRAYAGTSRQRMDYLIDPNWAGITPRTLVIRADGTRASAVGALTDARLRKLVGLNSVTSSVQNQAPTAAMASRSRR